MTNYPLGYPTIPDLSDPNFRDAVQRDFDDVATGLGTALTGAEPGLSGVEIGLLVVRGTFTAANPPVVQSGSGFTPTRNAVGDFNIAFSRAFGAAQTTVACAALADGKTMNAELVNVSNSRVTIVNNAGARVDGGSVNFIAMGPR